MIKLFRNIRKKLAAENKVMAYLRYAIGEILLVVIGILIALQINNWNEKRKQSELKTVYISRLISDIQQDTLNVQIIKKQTEEAQEIIKNTIHILNTESDLLKTMQALENYFEKGWDNRIFIVNDNTYTDLLQTGNMSILKENIKVEDIIKYYASAKISREADLGNENWAVSIDIALTEKTSALEFDPVTRELFVDKDKQISIKNMMAHKELLEKSAASHYWYNNSSLRRLATIENEAQKLLQSLSNELE